MKYFQVIRKISPLEIDNKAINKIAELIAYALGFNLFLFGAEVFKEFYSGTVHMAPLQYMYFGLHGHNRLVPWLWMAFIFNLVAFALFLSTRARENPVTLNLACSLVIVGVYVEKGMGLVIPGFIPGALGEIYEYSPTNHELLITIAIWALGALLYTLMLKFVIPVYTGELRFSDGMRVSAKVVSGQEEPALPEQGAGGIDLQSRVQDLQCFGLLAGITIKLCESRIGRLELRLQCNRSFECGLCFFVSAKRQQIHRQNIQRKKAHYARLENTRRQQQKSNKVGSISYS